MQLRPGSSYAHELRPDLPADTFAPARSRLLWIPVHLTVIALGSAAIVAGAVPWFAALAIALVMGVSWSGLTFLAHETLHGAVARGRRARWAVGFLGFLPFVVSPRLWVNWHNRVHHGNTGKPEKDPDAYPSLARYRKSRLVRVITDHFSVGPGRPGGAFVLLIGFFGQSLQMYLSAREMGMTLRDRAVMLAEAGAMIAFWAGVALLFGAGAFLFLWVIPAVVANAMVMSFIITNHHLSPQTEINDPLVNSLSVTTPRLVDWITLGFGFHVEHHLFPSMSTRHAGRVRDAILARWPERYQSMPMGRALRLLFTSGRVYKTNEILWDPRTGREYPTLAPRELPARDQDRAAA
jgi:fatty acid desaturase